MDRPAVHQVPEGSGEQGKMEETGCEIICGAPNDPRGSGIDDDDDDDDDDDLLCLSSIPLPASCSFIFSRSSLNMK